jgi:hypothetical protein
MSSLPFIAQQRVVPTAGPLLIPFGGGNFTLGAPTSNSVDLNALNLFYVVTGTFTADLVINFNGNLGVWQIDTGAAILNGFGVVIQNGTQTARLTASSIFTVSLPAANLITLIAPVSATFNDQTVSGGSAHTLTTPETLIGYIVCAGTLSANASLTFPIVGVWQVDTSAVTFNGHAIDLLTSGTGMAALNAPSIFTVSIPNENTVTVLAPVGVFPLALSVAGGNVTLTPSQSAQLYLVLSGTLTANFSVTFPLMGVWQVDTSQVTFDGFSIDVVSGTASAALNVPAVYTVSVPASNSILAAAPWNSPATRVTLVSTSFVAGVDETIVIVNQHFVGAPTITLPVVTGLASGQKFTVAVNSLFPSGTFNNVVQSGDATLVNGAASVTLSYAYGSTEFTYVKSGTASFWIASHTGG